VSGNLTERRLAGPRGRTKREVAALQAALAAEQAASYGYGIVGAHLTGTHFAAAFADSIAHQRARDSLTAMIMARGGQLRPAAPVYRMPIAVQTAAQARSLAIVLERQVTAAYLGLVALAEPVLRRFGADQMRAAAIRSARWGARPQAFPGLPASSLGRPGHTPATASRTGARAASYRVASQVR
jgi:hypothetical protein